MTLAIDRSARTARELAANLARTGLSSDQVAAALGFGPLRLAQTLRVAPGAHPADVWTLRDFLDGEVRARTCSQPEWTVLSDTARAAAKRRFALQRPPEPLAS